MLQASEYDLREYFMWHRRVRDFRYVEKRKKLVMTAKARLLFIFLWLMVLAGFLVNIIVILKLTEAANWLWLPALVLFDLIIPISYAYLIVIPLWLGQILIQKPKEYFIIKKARDKLADIDTIKIAIAGSYGKTTFKENLKTVLEGGKKVAATIIQATSPNYAV
jgi:hypothetical protein